MDYRNTQARSWASLQRVQPTRLQQALDGLMVALFLALLLAAWFVFPELVAA